MSRKSTSTGGKVLSGGFQFLTISVYLGHLGKVSIKKTLKDMELSIQILPTPLWWKKTHFYSTILFYVFIMFIITKFGENFEEKIDICFF